MILDDRDTEDLVIQTSWMIFASLRLESYPTDGHTDRRWENIFSPLRDVSAWVTKTCALSPNCPLSTNISFISLNSSVIVASV